MQKPPTSRKVKKRVASTGLDVSGDTVGSFVQKVVNATTSQLIEAERVGVRLVLLRNMAKELGLPQVRFFEIMGVTRLTMAREMTPQSRVAGMGGLAALNMARLLGIASRMVANSMLPQAEDFDPAKWLGQWINIPQPALGGLAPSQLVDTPSGSLAVARVLGAIESGAYQ